MWRLEYGFMRVRCEDCHHERAWFAFSCKRRGFCPSCWSPAGWPRVRRC
ncbi:transposase zinc-binding domain-containing protein [Citrobacter freundii]